MYDKHEAWKLLNLELLSVAKNKYEEEQRRWSTLEKKAEGAISISGLLIAAIIAFSKNVSELNTVSEKTIILLSIVILGISIGSSVFALRLRTVATSPPVAKMREEIGSLLADGNIEESEFLESSLAILNFFSEFWEKSTGELTKCIDEKLLYIKISQGGVFVALLLVCALFIQNLFK